MLVAIAYPCSYATTNILVINVGIAVKPYPPLIGIFRVANNLFSRTPPVAFFFIVSYLYHPHSRKMRSRYHIGKRRIFVCRRDCRSASILGLWCGVLFFAYPLGGVNLLFINQEIISLSLLCGLHSMRYGISISRLKLKAVTPILLFLCAIKKALHPFI